MADLTTVATNLGREAANKARAFADTNPVAKKTKDVAFTVVGLGVLGVQKATQAVKHVQGSVDTDGVSAVVKTSTDKVTESVKKQAAKADAVVVKATKKVDEVVAPVEAKMPAPVREAANKAREARTKVHATVSSKIVEKTDAE